MYNVVFKTIAEGPYKGVITWSTFDSKEEFDKWFSTKLKNMYEIVDQGVTSEKAVEYCSSPMALAHAFSAPVIAQLQKIKDICNDLETNLQQT